MTTLILNRDLQVLFADRQEVHNRSIKIETQKIIPLKLKNSKVKGWIALAGNSDEGETFLRYLSQLTNIHELKDLSDKRPRWKNLGGFIALLNGDTFMISGDGTPFPVTARYMADGAGMEAAICLLDAEVSVGKIYALLGKRTTHTSANFDHVLYTNPRAEIIHVENEDPPTR